MDFPILLYIFVCFCKYRWRIRNSRFSSQKQLRTCIIVCWRFIVGRLKKIPDNKIQFIHWLRLSYCVSSVKTWNRTTKGQVELDLRFTGESLHENVFWFNGQINLCLLINRFVYWFRHKSYFLGIASSQCLATATCAFVFKSGHLDPPLCDHAWWWLCCDGNRIVIIVIPTKQSNWILLGIVNNGAQKRGFETTTLPGHNGLLSVNNGLKLVSRAFKFARFRWSIIEIFGGIDFYLFWASSVQQRSNAFALASSLLRFTSEPIKYDDITFMEPQCLDRQRYGKVIDSGDWQLKSILLIFSFMGSCGRGLVLGIENNRGQGTWNYQNMRK